MTPRDNLLCGILFTIVAVVLGHRLGLVGFRYLVVEDNTELTSPVQVVRVDGDQMKLADGRMITLYGSCPESELRHKISRSKNRVEVETTPGYADVDIYFDEERFICGRPWDRLTIPIFPDRLPGNRRRLLDCGEINNMPEPASAPSPTPPNP